jgi:hypothetical protein
MAAPATHAAELPRARELSAELRPNPFSQVTVRRDGGQPVELRLWCVTRSRGAVTRNFAKTKDANFDRIYAAVAGQENEARRSLADLVVLAALGLWAPDFDLFDPIFFHAPVEPRPGETQGHLMPEDFALRGQVWLQENAEPPAPCRDFALGCLAPARPILWHRAGPSEPIWPYWPSPECVDAVAALQGLLPRRPDMVPALLALARQGVAESTYRTDREKAGAELDGRAQHDFFARERFAVTRRLLPPAQTAALRHYWQKLAALDVIPDRGDGGARRGSQGEPSSALLLYVLQPLVERILGAAMKPAYSYAWIYRRGAELPVHRDRDACRATVSLLADYAPVVDGPTPWPLGIHPRGGGAPIEIRQAVGDAVVFNGQELRHFRPRLTAGTHSISLLLHYVDRDFSGVTF